MLRGLSVVLIRVLAIWTFVNSWSYWGAILYYPNELFYYLNITIPAILALILWVSAIPVSIAIIPANVNLDQSHQIDISVVTKAGTFVIGLVLAVIGIAEITNYIPQFLALTSELAGNHSAEIDLGLYDRYYYFDRNFESFAKLGIGILIMLFHRKIGNIGVQG